MALDAFIWGLERRQVVMTSFAVAAPLTNDVTAPMPLLGHAFLGLQASRLDAFTPKSGSCTGDTGSVEPAYPLSGAEYPAELA